LTPTGCPPAFCFFLSVFFLKTWHAANAVAAYNIVGSIYVVVVVAAVDVVVDVVVVFVRMLQNYVPKIKSKRKNNTTEVR
jgi:hypothetical protein